MEFDDNDYQCAGICQPGSDGLCRGCGRPMWVPAKETAAQESAVQTPTGDTSSNDAVSQSLVRR